MSLYYLLHRNFNHNDLLGIVEKEDNNVHRYIEKFCKKSFVITFVPSAKSAKFNFLQNIFYAHDDKLFFLHFLYCVEHKKGNQLSAYAYYKNFFDRISAHIAAKVRNDGKNGKPNYKNYYKESALINLYSDCAGSENIIKDAHKLRNSNPLSHASAELIDRNDSSAEVIEVIAKLNEMLLEKIGIICSLDEVGGAGAEPPPSLPQPQQQ